MAARRDLPLREEWSCSATWERALTTIPCASSVWARQRVMRSFPVVTGASVQSAAKLCFRPQVTVHFADRRPRHPCTSLHRPRSQDFWRAWDSWEVPTVICATVAVSRRVHSGGRRRKAAPFVAATVWGPVELPSFVSFFYRSQEHDDPAWHPTHVESTC